MTPPCLVWWDGRLIEEAAALVPATSQGWLWGRGVFETLSVRDGQVRALSRHLARLRSSAGRLALPFPEEITLQNAVGALLEQCPSGPYRLRITLAAGDGPGIFLTAEPPHLLLRLLPAPPPARENVLLTVPWRRNEFSPLSGVKCTSYAENPIALAWARDRGATEALFLNTAGDLCEGAVSNLFLVSGGMVLTPFLGSGCLPGIARSLVLDLCPQLGIACQQRALSPTDLQTADGVFLTNSVHGILPVSTCDHRTVDTPCPITARLQAGYEDLLDRLPDP